MEGGSGSVGSIKDKRQKTKETRSQLAGGTNNQDPATSTQDPIHMSDISTFESRTGSISCTPEEMYHFLTDMRNFGRFIPDNNISGVSISEDSCIIDVNLLGKVNIRIGGKKEFSEVVYAGSAAQINDFTLSVKFGDIGTGPSGVKLTVTAHLNPFLKMLAAEPINKFLETIIGEMEKFNGWTEVRRDR